MAPCRKRRWRESPESRRLHSTDIFISKESDAPAGIAGRGAGQICAYALRLGRFERTSDGRMVARGSIDAGSSGEQTWTGARIPDVSRSGGRGGRGADQGAGGWASPTGEGAGERGALLERGRGSDGAGSGRSGNAQGWPPGVLRISADAVRVDGGVDGGAGGGRDGWL